jgi:hypothetical protein
MNKRNPYLGGVAEITTACGLARLARKSGT